MKNDDIRQLRVNDGVSLRGHVSKMDGDKVLITFPEISHSLWVWERHVCQDFFVRSAPPEERWSYDALKYGAEKMKERLEAAEKLLYGIRLNISHLNADLRIVVMDALKLNTMLAENAYDEMLGAKTLQPYPADICHAASRAASLAARVMDTLDSVKRIINAMDHAQGKESASAGSSGVTKGGEA